MKTIFITGVTGQLGAWLSKLYLEKGWRVIGGIRRSANYNPWRLKTLGILEKIEFETIDLSDQSSLDEAIKKWKPDCLVNAAAQSFVGSSWTTGEYTLDITGIGVYRILEAIRKHSPQTKAVQMSSSEMFGNNPDYPYNEKSLFMPRSPYGCAKCLGYHLISNFRESYKIYASNLISFNFESPLRGIEFLTKKAVVEAVRVIREINTGTVSPISVGNLTPTRDWLWAEDTANAIYLMLEQDKPDDFCIGTGVTTSVKEFVNKTFLCLGHKLTWFSEHKETPSDVIEFAMSDKASIRLVESVKSLYRPADVPHLIADATKARTILGWKPTKTLDETIKAMVDFELTGKLC